MNAWEILDAQGRVRKRVVGPLRFACQFQHEGEEWRTLRRAQGDPELGGRAALAGAPLPRPGATRVNRIGSAPVRAKRERLRARLEAEPEAFTRAALAALIEAGALDATKED